MIYQDTYEMLREELDDFPATYPGFWGQVDPKTSSLKMTHLEMR